MCGAYQCVRMVRGAIDYCNMKITSSLIRERRPRWLPSTNDCAARDYDWTHTHVFNVAYELRLEKSFAKGCEEKRGFGKHEGFFFFFLHDPPISKFVGFFNTIFLFFRFTRSSGGKFIRRSNPTALLLFFFYLHLL